MHLTELTISKLKPGVYMDDRLPDFGLRVGARRRSWIVVRGRARTKETVGHHPGLSLSEARAKAKLLLTAPVEQKLVAKGFTEARSEFLATYKNPKTKYQVERSFTRHFKALESRALPDIEDIDIEAVLKKLSRTPSEQLHAYRYIRTFFAWAQRRPRRYVKHSPMEGYEPPGEDRKGTRILSDDELIALYKAAEGPRLAFFRLLILWGTRNTETLVARSTWASGGILTIPGEHTKNGRDHAIPVCALAQGILDTLSTNYEHLFPGRWGDGHMKPGAIGKLKRELEKKSGVAGWQTRDLRRTFRTNMRRLGVPSDVCETLINHTPAKLIQIYDRYHFLPEKRAALERYDAFIQTLLSRDKPGLASSFSKEPCDENAKQEGTS